MNTETRSLYKIWRFRRGRSLKRWLTDEQVAGYKERNPLWRWEKIQVEHRSYQASLQARPRQEAQGYGHGWGLHTAELIDKKRNSPQYGGQPVISWDDILDVQLALKGGNLKMTGRQRVLREQAIGRITSAVWDAEEIGIITARKAGQFQRLLTEATEKGIRTTRHVK